MRAIIALAIIMAAGPTSAANAQATEREAMDELALDSLRVLYDHVVLGGLRDADRGLIHPASMALQEREVLELSRQQIDVLVDIEEELVQVFVEFATSMQVDGLRPSMWWDGEPVNDAEIRAAAFRTAEQQTEAMLLLLRLRDRVFQLLTDEQGAQLREAYRRQLGALWDTATQGPSSSPCTRGSSGGGGFLNERAHMVWSVTFQGDSARIDAVFIARAENRLRGSGSLMRPRPELPTQSVSGGSAGNWHLLHDRDSRTAYVQDRPVELGDNNVVLVHGIDRIHEPPDVIRTLHIPSRFFTAGCPDGEDWVEALRTHVLAVPEIGEFIGRR